MFINIYWKFVAINQYRHSHSVYKSKYYVRFDSIRILYISSHFI